MMVKSVMDHRKEGKPLFADLSIQPRVLAVAGVLAVYMAALNFIGFILSTLAFTYVNPIVMGYKKYRALAIYSLILTVVAVVVFGKFFYVPLPRGIGFLRELSYYLY